MSKWYYSKKTRKKLIQISTNQEIIKIEKLSFYKFPKGIISAQELEKHKIAFLRVEKNYTLLLGSISQLISTFNQHNKNNKITKIEENKENINLKNNTSQSFYQLKKAIKDWELNYILRSSIDGKISFLQLWAKSQNVNAGDNVFSIIPTNKSNYVGKVKAPAQNSGKIKLGQTVNIRLANDPDREFGVIKGIIDGISLIPDKDGFLLINVTLPKGLETSYKKQIVFQQEMIGTADLVTDDLRLIERLLYQFKMSHKH